MDENAESREGARETLMTRRGHLSELDAETVRTLCARLCAQCNWQLHLLDPCFRPTPCSLCLQLSPALCCKGECRCERRLRASVWGWRRVGTRTHTSLTYTAKEGPFYEQYLAHQRRDINSSERWSSSVPQCPGRAFTRLAYSKRDASVVSESQIPSCEPC